MRDGLVARPGHRSRVWLRYATAVPSSERSTGAPSRLSVIHVIARYQPPAFGAQNVAHYRASLRRRSKSSLIYTSRGTASTRNTEQKGFVRRFWSFKFPDTDIMPGLVVGILRLSRGSVIHLHVTSAFTPEAVYAAHVLRRVPHIAHIHFDVTTFGSWNGKLLRFGWMPVVLPRGPSVSSSCRGLHGGATACSSRKIRD